MKITPISDNEIRVETDKGIFDVYSLVGGGLEIHSQEGKTMTFRPPRETEDGGMNPAITGVRAVVIKEDMVRE